MAYGRQRDWYRCIGYPESYYNLVSGDNKNPKSGYFYQRNIPLKRVKEEEKALKKDLEQDLIVYLAQSILTHPERSHLPSECIDLAEQMLKYFDIAHPDLPEKTIEEAMKEWEKGNRKK